MDDTVVKVPQKGVTGTGLKMIALIAMLIDHVAAILITDYLEKVIPTGVSPEELQEWFAQNRQVAVLEMIMGLMRLIGRFGFPLFAFLLVEGFIHTRSVAKYALNLLVFALISELPFDLGFAGELIYPGYQNVFFTLLLGLLCLWCMKLLPEKFGHFRGLPLLFYVAAFLFGPYALYMLFYNTWPGGLLMNGLRQAVPEAFSSPVNMTMLFVWCGSAVVSLLAIYLIRFWGKWDEGKTNAFTLTVLPVMFFSVAADLLKTDYSGGGVLTIVVMALVHANLKKAFSLGCLVLTLMSPVEATAFLMLIPLSKYNGKRGMRMNKYVFYAFYPIHIGLIYLLTLVLGFTTFSLGGW